MTVECALIVRLVATEVALLSAREVIRAQTRVLLAMRSPDGKHRALRSAYSPRGVCEVYPAGQHSHLCTDFWDGLRDGADWWDAFGEPDPVTVETCEQVSMFEEVAG